MWNIFLYLFSFLVIWFGAGLAIGAVERFSKSLKLSSFTVSFLILGFFTSISELSVGVNAIIDNDPEIFVGNLIGASIVIFMLIVPLLAIIGNSLTIQPQFRGRSLMMSLIVIAAPVLLSLDGNVNRFDGLICILLYFALAIMIQRRKGFLERLPGTRNISRRRLLTEIGKVVAGILLIFGASNIVVDLTLIFSAQSNLSPFLLSLLLVSIGTNLPELSLILRSAFKKNKDVAFGDYVGSASFNTFLVGFLTLVYGKPVFLTNSYAISLLYLILGLGLFYWFSRSRNTVTRTEGLILLLIYIAFLITELVIH